MNLSQIKKDKGSVIVFEDVFIDQELKQIWEEVDFVSKKYTFLGPEHTSSAINEDGMYMKNNKGLWLDGIYENRQESIYLNLYKKFIDYIKDQKDQLIENDINLKLFFNTNDDYTMINYYDTGDYYDCHIDRSCYTYLFWMYKEPKSFTGGDLFFPELDLSVDVKNNKAILFPSWLDHKVSKVIIENKSLRYDYKGRFCFSSFFQIFK